MPSYPILYKSQLWIPRNLSTGRRALYTRDGKSFFILLWCIFLLFVLFILHRYQLWLHFCRLSEDVRITNVGPVNTKLYSPSLKSYCQYNDSEITKSRLQLRADNLTSELEKVKRIELEDRLSNDDNVSGELSVFVHSGDQIRWPDIYSQVLWSRDSYKESLFCQWETVYTWLSFA